MDNRIEGTAHEAKGSIKETLGAATGDRSQQAEGKAEREAGKAERMIAEMAERMRRHEAHR